MESDLPLEVLSHTLSYLPPMQRLSAGLVCKRWLQATDPLLEDVCLTIRDEPPTPLTGRAFPRITFRLSHIDDRCVDLLSRLGPQLLHLSFVDCTVGTTKNKDVDCPRLQTLAADCGDVLIVFASLPRMLDLNLRLAADLTDDTLVAFEQIRPGPNLEIFSMPNAAVYERLVYKRFYPKGKTPESHPSPYILSHAALETFVARRAPTLKMLHLPNKITPDAALYLSRVAGLNLRSVSFAGCREEIAPIVPQFCRNQLGVVVLNLDSLQSLKNEVVLEIFELLPGLRECSVRGCSRFLDWGVMALFRMPRLRALCLSSCVAITDMAFLAAARMKDPLLELRTLDLSHLRIQDELLGDLLWQTPRLMELDVSGCVISDATLARVCPRLTRLRALVLRDCKRVTDIGLCELQHLTSLASLDLRGCPGLSSVGVAEYTRFRPKVDLQFINCL